MTPESITAEQIERQRDVVLEHALQWLRTPYHHGARRVGEGVDCGNFVAACYEAAGLVPRGAIDCRASADWYLHAATEPWLAALAPFTVPLAPGARPARGDLVLFRLGRATAAHGGIIAGVSQDGVVALVHADRGTGVVLDTLTPHAAWAPRVSGYHTLRRWA